MNSKTQDPYDDELDLFGLFETPWSGKLITIANAIVIVLLSIVTYQTLQKSAVDSTSSLATKASTFTKHIPTKTVRNSL
jgi:LPS O-antigen subunit length determinant protein (WzzB/FepE family)